MIRKSNNSFGNVSKKNFKIIKTYIQTIKRQIMNNSQSNCIATAHHIQLSFSENNELIVRSYASILMHKIIIPIENMHYLYVTQSNSYASKAFTPTQTAHFNFQLQFYSAESNLAKQYDWIELTGVLGGKHIYTIKSNMVFITNIDEISLDKKQKYQEKTDIYCLMANEHNIFYLNLNLIERVETYLKNPITTQMQPIYHLRFDNDGRIFSNIKTKPFAMFAKIIMKPLGSLCISFAASFDIDILDVLTFYYQYRSKQVDVLSEQSKSLLFRLMEFLNKVPY